MCVNSRAPVMESYERLYILYQEQLIFVLLSEEQAMACICWTARIRGHVTISFTDHHVSCIKHFFFSLQRTKVLSAINA